MPHVWAVTTVLHKKTVKFPTNFLHYLNNKMNKNFFLVFIITSLLCFNVQASTLYGLTPFGSAVGYDTTTGEQVGSIVGNGQFQYNGGIAFDNKGNLWGLNVYTGSAIGYDITTGERVGSIVGNGQFYPKGSIAFDNAGNLWGLNSFGSAFGFNPITGLQVSSGLGIYGSFQIGGKTGSGSIAFAPSLTAVPLPASLWLFISGIALIIGKNNKYKATL